MAGPVPLLALAPFLALLLLPASASAGIRTPFVGSYWESWAHTNWPDDFCSDLSTVPAQLQGTNHGVNVVTIGFGDFSGGVSGVNASYEHLSAGIQHIHQAGGYVKLAYGGSKYSMSTFIQTNEEAAAFCEILKGVQEELGIDGVDFYIENHDTSAELQIEMFRACRELLGPDFHMSYSIAALGGGFQPWNAVLAGSVELLDAVNVMSFDYYWEGYTFDADRDLLLGFGYSAAQIMYGIMPGHHDAPNEYTAVEDALDVAKYVVDNKLGGAFTWTLNRDTKQRMGFEEGEDNLMQTGQRNGAYIDNLSRRIYG